MYIELQPEKTPRSKKKNEKGAQVKKKKLRAL